MSPVKDEDEFTQAMLGGDKAPIIPVASAATSSASVAPVAERPTDQRELARQAMEGPERTIKRKEEERATVIKTELIKIDKRLAELSKEKENLELKWIELDNKRSAIKQILDPIKEKERAIEVEETTLESEEGRQPFPKEKHLIEEKRWPIQAKRHEIETEKWTVEQKILVLEEQLAGNTAAYQKFLDEEEEIKTVRSNLEKELEQKREL